LSVSISEIIAGAKVHAVPLAGECAGYLVLAAAYQAVTAPRRIGPAEVRLFDDGTVRVEGSRAAAESDAEGDLRALLDALLVRASSATPALLRASRRAPGRGIAALVREIETALIPVNRAAAHRALARLERETERARHAGRLDLSAPTEVVRSEAPKPTVVPPTPPPPSIEPPAVGQWEEPVREIAAVEEALTEGADEIPSLFAPPVESIASVESIAALAAEIETRPEPVVLRRSTRPPPLPKTPSPPPLPVRDFRSPLPPVALRTASPPPLPVAEAQPTTPFFGTVLQSFADDEMEIEVVLEEELMEDELTGVLVRSAPLEVSAMPNPTATAEPTAAETESLDTTETPDTDPSPPVLDDEPEHEPSAVAPFVAEPSSPENTMLDAQAAELPAVALEGSTILAEAQAPAPEPEGSTLAAEEPVPLGAEPESTVLLVQTAPIFPMPSVELPSPKEPMEPLVAEPPEPHGDTLALALAIDPVPVEIPPAPRLAMPKPRPSDVDDLLERMAEECVEGSDEIRANLKGLAGLEPTPPPPDS
jgi:hypothetical protein